MTKNSRKSSFVGAPTKATTCKNVWFRNVWVPPLQSLVTPTPAATLSSTLSSAGEAQGTQATNAQYIFNYNCHCVVSSILSTQLLGFRGKHLRNKLWTAGYSSCNEDQWGNDLQNNLMVSMVSFEVALQQNCAVIQEQQVLTTWSFKVPQKMGAIASVLLGSCQMF